MCNFSIKRSLLKLLCTIYFNLSLLPNSAVLAENHRDVDLVLPNIEYWEHDVDELASEDSTPGIPRIPPELLGYHIKRSSHQPLCLYYEGKAKPSFEQQLFSYWKDLPDTVPYSSWRLKAISGQSQKDMDLLPVVKCYIGPTRMDEYRGKASIKLIHTFLVNLVGTVARFGERMNERCERIQEWANKLGYHKLAYRITCHIQECVSGVASFFGQNKQRLIEADVATLDEVILNSAKLTCLIFLNDETKHFDLEMQLIQLQETWRDDILVLVVHSKSSDDMILQRRFSVTKHPTLVLIDGKEWKSGSTDILRSYEGALATIANVDYFISLYLSPSINILNLDSFKTEVMTVTDSPSPILVCFHAIWGNEVSGYISAIQRSADTYAQLGAQLRFAAVDLANQQEVVSRWVNATYVKTVPFSVVFWWTQESSQDPVLQQRLLTGGVPTPWTIADFLGSIGVPLLDSYGNSIRYNPWGDTKVAYGFSTWSSYNPCITSINASDTSGDLSGDQSCDPGLRGVFVKPDRGEDSSAKEDMESKTLPEKPRVPRVTDSTWSRIVEQSHLSLTKTAHAQLTGVWKGDVTPTILIVFIQDGCRSCERNMKIFDKLAMTISYIEGASLYLHNCTSDPVTCDLLNIRGFPTVIAFRGYGQITSKRCLSIEQQARYIRMDYHGVIEEEYILTWFSEISLAAVTKVTLAEFEEKKQAHDVVLLATLYPHSIARQYLPLISGPDSWYPFECFRVACERLYGKAMCYAAITKNLQKRDVEFSQEEQRMVVTQVDMYRRDGVHSMVFSLGRILIKSLQDEADKQLHQFHSPHKYNLRPSQRCEDNHAVCTDLISAFVRDHSRLPVTRITLASFHTHGSPNLDTHRDGSIHDYGRPVLITLGHTEDLIMGSSLMQDLTEAAYEFYNEMVFVSLDVNEFPQWASHFVPQGYSRLIFENTDEISEDVLPSLYVYPRLCIIHEEDHRHAAFYPPHKQFSLMPKNATQQITKEEIINFAESFLQEPDGLLVETEQF